MKALILVGGFGTRLRPLTFSMPKPLVPFANIPMIVHQLIALKEAGVTTVVLAVAYQPSLMAMEMEEWGKRLGLTIVFSVEDTPLGTAGPLALAEEYLTGDQPFFVLNSDVTCDFALSDLLAFHQSHGGEGSIQVTEVADPSRYGVVVHDSGSGKITAFVEKPQSFVGNHINAGIYCLSPKVLKRIPREANGAVVPTSIERIIFPAIAAEGGLFARPLPGFWMDLGKPGDFVDGLGLFLRHAAAVRARTGDAKSSSLLAITAAKSKLVDGSVTGLPYEVIGNVLIHESAEIGHGAVLGPNVAVGPNAVIGANSRVATSAVLGGAKIAAAAFVSGSILGPEVRLGRWAHIESCVLGEGVNIKDGTALLHVHAAPHITLSQAVSGTAHDPRAVYC